MNQFSSLHFWFCATIGLFSVPIISVAQYSKPFEISLVPSIGWNASYLVFAPGSSKEDWLYTQRFLSSQGIYFGIGIQATYDQVWQANLSVQHTSVGGGLEMLAPMPWTDKRNRGGSISGHGIGAFRLQIERSVYTFPHFKLKGKKLHTGINGLFGLGASWIPAVQSGVSNGGSGGFYNSINKEVKVLHRYAGAITLGVTNQWFVKDKPRIKLGVNYTFGIRPIESWNYTISYIDNQQEQFTVHTGRHQVTAYLEFPIALYRNKSQKLIYQK